MTDELMSQAESCVCHNISDERVFGQLDHELKRAPNAGITYGESKIMYKNNSTEERKGKRSRADKENPLQTARVESRKSVKKDKHRQRQIEEQKREHLESKRKEAERKEEGLRDSREALLDD